MAAVPPLGFEPRTDSLVFYNEGSSPKTSPRGGLAFIDALTVRPREEAGPTMSTGPLVPRNSLSAEGSYPEQYM